MISPRWRTINSSSAYCFFSLPVEVVQGTRNQSNRESPEFAGYYHINQEDRHYAVGVSGMIWSYSANLRKCLSKELRKTCPLSSWSPLKYLLKLRGQLHGSEMFFAWPCPSSGYVWQVNSCNGWRNGIFACMLTVTGIQSESSTQNVLSCDSRKKVNLWSQTDYFQWAKLKVWFHA